MTRFWPLVLLASVSAALAADQVQRSGLDYATPGVRAMQEDDFANPAMLWVAEGEALWNQPAGKNCQSCHGTLSGMADIAYPRRDPRDPGTLMNLESRIEQCRVEHVGAPAYGYESRELLALTAAIRNRARGRPAKVVEDAAAIAGGEAYYRMRRGAFDLSCAQCHEERAGRQLRDEVISQGQSNGFPAYRLRWQGLGSLHRRFQVCNAAVGAEPSPLGSQEYIALEWYLAWRGRSLPVEAPAVRQ